MFPYLSVMDAQELSSNAGPNCSNLGGSRFSMWSDIGFFVSSRSGAGLPGRTTSTGKVYGWVKTDNTWFQFEQIKKRVVGHLASLLLPENPYLYESL